MKENQEATLAEKASKELGAITLTIGEVITLLDAVDVFQAVRKAFGTGKQGPEARAVREACFASVRAKLEGLMP